MSYREAFAAERYETVSRRIMTHRIDNFIREVESRAGRNKGNIMPFVRGLRFSALLIYQIRNILSNSNLSAYWGQIIDEDYTYLSNECDIIISENEAFEQKWNGDGGGNDVMDFRFIPKDKVKAVISCKSFITKSSLEKDYCENLLRYIDKVWLFAECCGPKSVSLIRNASSEIGYEYFWNLYTWNRNNGETKQNLEVWKHFEGKIVSLVTD